MLLANSKQAAKLSAAHELSANGEERKRLAGEMIWSKAVVKAKLGGDPGNTAKERSKIRRTEIRCAIWAMDIATQASNPS